MAIDTETTGLRVKDGTDNCIGISVAGRVRQEDNRMFSYYFPVAHHANNLNDINIALLYEHFRSRTRRNPVVYHNAKFDLFSLATAGCDMDSVFFYDTLIMARIVNENIWGGYGLDNLAKVMLKREGKRKSPEFHAFFQMFGWSALFPAVVMGDYATGDTELTLLLFEYLYPIFKREGFDG